MDSRENVVSVELLAAHPEWCRLLAEWYFAEWPELYPVGGFADALAEAESCRNADRLNVTVVLTVNGEPAGASSLLVDDVLPLPECSPWLGTVIVLPQFRGLGLGKRIVRAAMSHAGAIGIATLHLWTPKHRRFYEPLGWRYVATATAAGEEVAVMRCDDLGGKSGVGDRVAIC